MVRVRIFGRAFQRLFFLRRSSTLCKFCSALLSSLLRVYRYGIIITSSRYCQQSIGQSSERTRDRKIKQNGYRSPVQLTFVSSSHQCQLLCPFVVSVYH